MLERGQVFELGGKRIFAMGGASSHDIRDGILEPDDPLFQKKFQRLNAQGALFRINHRSWWEEELPSEEEYEEARANLEKAGWAVDYIVTHCAPTSIQNALLRELSTPDADRLPGGNQPAVPVQVPLLRPLPQQSGHPAKICPAV